MSRKLLFPLTALLMPFFFLLLVEGMLRLFSFGNDLQLLSKVRDGGEVWWQVNQNVSRRYFLAEPEEAREAQEIRFAYKKPVNGLRIICLGGSSMKGFPYDYNATMPGMLYKLLREQAPDRQVEVINLGIAAVSSYAVRDLMRDVVKLKPDAILIYAGHNEFYGAQGIASTFAGGSGRYLKNLSLYLLRYRSYYLLQQTISNIGGWFRAETPESGRAMENVMERMARDRVIPLYSPLVQQARDDFRANMQDAVQIAAKKHVPVLIGSLVSNERDFPPFISQAHSADKEEQQKVLINQAFALMTSRNNAAALGELRAAVALDSTAALPFYLLGKAGIAAGDTLAAAYALAKARDLDLLRFRAPSQFNRVLYRLCESSEAHFVDVEKLFRSEAADGIPGNDLFCEHLHPNVRGYALMSLAFLEQLQALKIVEAAQRRRDWRDARANVTLLDEQIGRLRIRKLSNRWPFKQQLDILDLPENALSQYSFELARRYLDKELNWGEAHAAMAQQLQKWQRYREALDEYRVLLNYYPEIYLGKSRYTLLDRQAEAQIAMGDLDRAFASTRESLSVNEDSPLAMVNLGKIYIGQNKFAAAEQVLGKALQSNEKKSVFSRQYASYVLYLLASSLANQQKNSAAVTRLQTALKLDPQNSPAAALLEALVAGGVSREP